MNYDELSNALTYGSNDKTIGGKSKYNLKSSLGKYGLGLKTASTAFCRKITMLTKKKEEWGNQRFSIFSFFCFLEK